MTWIKKNALVIVILVLIGVIIKMAVFPATSKKHSKTGQYKIIDSAFALIRYNLFDAKTFYTLKLKNTETGEVAYRFFWQEDSIENISIRDSITHKVSIMRTLKLYPDGRIMKTIAVPADIYPDQVPFKTILDWRSLKK